jgi:uncharacterized membrane protein
VSEFNKHRTNTGGFDTMSALDIFALFVLIVLLFTIIAVIGVLGALPGRIARNRRHPQADAIAVGGWLGLLFLGVLWPVMMIWAFTRTGNAPSEHDQLSATIQEGIA